MVAGTSLGFSDLRQPCCSLRYGYNRQCFDKISRHIVEHPNFVHLQSVLGACYPAQALSATATDSRRLMTQKS